MILTAAKSLKSMNRSDELAISTMPQGLLEKTQIPRKRYLRLSCCQIPVAFILGFSG